VARSKRDPLEFLETYASLKRTLTALAQDAYAQQEVGVLQAKCVRHIGVAGSISQAELARRTDSDPALTGRALATLIDRGWVKRERSEADRREYVLQLSPSGKRAQERIERARQEFAAKIVAVLDERDAEDFARITQKVLSALG
jgi:DNA-binding MarR family transcriptional regulator